jgi:hypothetical protein
MVGQKLDSQWTLVGGGYLCDAVYKYIDLKYLLARVNGHICARIYQGGRDAKAAASKRPTSGQAQ